MSFRRLWACVVTVGSALSATANPFWVSYEGDDYPENQGWTRIIEGDGPANRSLADGVLTIDSLWSTQVSDFYRIDRPVNPGSGEVFVSQWRVRVNTVVGNTSYDPGLAFFSDDTWGLGFLLGHGGLWGNFEHQLFIPYEPDVFHAFELRSRDMRTYELFMDGALAHVGMFWEPAVTGPYVAWGDATRGSASDADWDYFRFGVIPEPASILLTSAMACAMRRSLFTRRTT